MIHRGEIVEKVVRNSGISLTKVAQKMGKSRRWLYNAFDISDLSLDYILEFGKILHYDFSGEIPQISSYRSSFSESPMIYGEHTIAYWRDKYYTLLEEHNQLLKQSSNQKKKSNKKEESK